MLITRTRSRWEDAGVRARGGWAWNTHTGPSASAARRLTASRRAARRDRGHRVVPGARPQGRRRVHGLGDPVGRALVVDPPAHELGPGVGRIAGDREAYLAQPVHRVEELLIGQGDPRARVGLLRHL